MRETRRFKTRNNFVLSFGDIMLPVVGIVAIGLLFVAGKFFFSSGFQTDHPPLPVDLTVLPRVEAAPAEASVQYSPAEAPGAQGPDPANPLAFPYSSYDGNEGERTEKPEPKEEVLAVPVTQERVVVVSNSRTQTPSPQPQPAKAQPAQPQKSNPVRREPVKPQQIRPAAPLNSQKTVPQKKEPVATATPQAATAASEPAWMVQLGAFSTRAAAEIFSKSLTKAGHAPVIISNKTLHRVLVPSGATKDEATRQATRMIQSGYSGAFIVPPRS